MIRIDEIGFGGFKIYQDSDDFLYGIDAVILSCFTARYAKKGSCAIDLGTNTGIIPTIILSKRTEFNFIGVEVQKNGYELAKLGAKENGLLDNLSFINSDILDLEGKVPFGSFDLVTMNPPYMEKGSALESEKESKLIARTETTASLDDFLRVSSKLLKPKGELFMVNRPYRMVDIFEIARKYKLEPKLLQFISPKVNENPNLVLFSFTKCGGKEMKILPEVNVRDGDIYGEEFTKLFRQF